MERGRERGREGGREIKKKKKTFIPLDHTGKRGYFTINKDRSCGYGPRKEVAQYYV